MNKKTIISIVAILIIVVVSFVLWQGRQTPAQKYTGPVEEIRLGVSKSVPQLLTLIYVAQSKGYFTDNKLNVIINVEPDTTTITVVRKNVAEGILDIGTSSDFGFVRDSFTVPNLRILAVISNTKLIEIIGRKDKGITTPQDLREKKIAVSPKSFGEFFFGQFLLFNNLKLSDVTVVPTNLDKVQDAIVAGTVDAAVTNDPFAYQIKQALGKNAAEVPTQLNRNNNLLLISNEEAIKSKPAAIERFLAALVQAEEFIKANPQESKKIIAKQFSLDNDYLDQTWPKSTFALSLSQSLLIAMEEEARWVIANKLTDKTIVPNYTDFTYKDALRNVKLEAVTLY